MDVPAATAPTPSAVVGGGAAWAASLVQRTALELRSMSSGLRAYYEGQNELITFYQSVYAASPDSAAEHLDAARAEAASAAAASAAAASAAAASAAAAAAASSAPAPPAGGVVSAAADSEGEHEDGVLVSVKSPVAATGATSGLPSVEASSLPSPPRPSREDRSLTAEDQRVARLVSFAIEASFAANVLLLAVKVYVSTISGSLAVIASTVDSVMDLVSGGVVWLGARLAARQQPYAFPVGKTRYEPLSIIIFAALMGAASLQLITQGIVQLIGGEPADTDVGGVVTYAVLGSVIVTKGLLWLLCMSLKRYSTSVGALALDHWADVITNLAPLITVLVVSRWPSLWWLDPTAAILMALYMLWLWGSAGSAQAALLTGKAATSREVSEITFLALTHDPAVLAVDTVLAYSVGNKLLAEVDIMLPRSTPLWESHDIGEGLQRKVERLVNIERCFVHADYEITHKKDDEHWHPSEQPNYAPPE